MATALSYATQAQLTRLRVGQCWTTVRPRGGERDPSVWRNSMPSSYPLRETCSQDSTNSIHWPWTGRAGRAFSALRQTTSRPHFLFFKNGEHVDTVEGINAPQIEKFIGDFIPEGVIETDDVGDEEEDDD